MDVTERGALAAIELFKVGSAFKHYGIKGMKWGVRKGEGSSGPQEVKVSQPKPGGPLVKTGGKGHGATDEAIRVAALRQKARKSGTVALTNKELQEVVTRMNLAQQYSKLNDNQKSKGQKFVSDLLFNAGKQQAQVFVNQQVGSAVGSYMGKKVTKG